MKTKPVCTTAQLIILLAISFSQVFAQAQEQKLVATILHADSAFWNAYNNCDTAHFKDFITDDVEFYHDKGGITSGAKALIESLNKNICVNADSRLRREAVTGTVKVYPMQNGNEIYGAIILGEHKFFITEKGKAEYESGVANFNQLWLLNNSVWKMSRILSFNHHAPEYINPRKEIEQNSNQLDQFRGTYHSNQSGTMTIIRQNNLLILKGGNNSYTLYPKSETSFFTKDRDLIFEFVKDVKGKPAKMIVKEFGVVTDELLFEK